MFDMVRRVTRNSPARDNFGSPVLARFLISKICSLVSFLFPSLDLLTISRLLSRYVPKKRCLGLTHKRLSQRWQTLMPFGTSPLYIRHAQDDDVLGDPFHENCPYPWLPGAPFQFQHPVDFSKLNSNLHFTEQNRVFFHGAKCAPHLRHSEKSFLCVMGNSIHVERHTYYLYATGMSMVIA